MSRISIGVVLVLLALLRTVSFDVQPRVLTGLDEIVHSDSDGTVTHESDDTHESEDDE
jgi:hypothetical protein